MSKGYIYVLGNEAMPDIYKIGRTDNIERRLNDLFNTSVPFPFDCVYACEVDDMEKVESHIHDAFITDRLNPKREFFKLDPVRVIKVLELVGHGDISSSFNNKTTDNITKEDITAKEKYEKRPKYNFKELGVPIDSDAVITYTEDSNITAIVKDIRKVEYNGEELSLTALTKKLLGLSYNVAPLPYWTYNGKNLSDVYEELYPREEE